MDFAALVRERLTSVILGIFSFVSVASYLNVLKTQMVGAIVVVCVLVVLFIYLTGRPVLTPLDVETRKILSLVDHQQANGYDLEDAVKAFKSSNNPRPRAGRFIAACIGAARAEYGLVTECEANRLMIRKFIRDKMRKHGMRESHIAAHCDTAVTIYFIPLDSDIAEGKRRNGLIGGHQRAENQRAWARSPLGDRSLA
jgi:hypothetical protein